MLKTKIWPDTY